MRTVSGRRRHHPLWPFEQPPNPHMVFLAPNVPPNYPITQGPFSGAVDGMLWAQWFSPLPVRFPIGQGASVQLLPVRVVGPYLY